MNIYTHPVTGQVYEWPQPATAGSSEFNGLHMSLIPKGRYRGMVFVWGTSPVLADHPPSYVAPQGPLPALLANERMSFQPYAIVDPADTPTVTDPGINIPFRFRNFLLPLGIYNTNAPQFFAQDLFCAGHAWSPFGDLIVAGGTDFTPAFYGADRTFAFNPRRDTENYPLVPGVNMYPGFVGLWVPGPDLEDKRWYPTMTLTHRYQRTINGANPNGREVVVVSGGSNDNVNNTQAANPTWNSYEALVIDDEASVLTGPGFDKDSTGQSPNQIYRWAGPGTPTGPYEVDWLYEYPRLHLLSNGRLFMSGYVPRWASLDHDGAPGVWISGGTQQGGNYSSNWPHIRHDAPCFLFPNLGGGGTDIVYRLGGCDEHWYLPAAGNGSPNGTTPTMEWIYGTVPTATWQTAAPMPTTPTGNGTRGRFLTNAIILPTGGILVIGGTHRAANSPSGLQNMTHIMEPQLYENGTWTTLSANDTPLPASPRDYHSAAILLPDGRVFVGGGESRIYDYEIYSPPYLSLPQPQNLTFNPQPLVDPDMGAFELNYGQGYTVQCPPFGEDEFAKAVLMAPASNTHHSDMHARYVETSALVTTQTYITFKVPGSDNVAPRGIYMLFLVTVSGAVSEALWVVLR